MEAVTKTTGKSRDEVIDKMSQELTGQFLMANRDWFLAEIHRLRDPVAKIRCQVAGMPIEARVYMLAFAKGISVCIDKVISGDLDLGLFQIDKPKEDSK